MHTRACTAAILLTTHAAVIAGVLGFVALAEWRPMPDANIGSGLGMLALSGLGLPWSAAYLGGLVGAHVTPTGQVALIAATAVVDLVLHGACWAWALRPAAMPAPGPAPHAR